MRGAWSENPCSAPSPGAPPAAGAPAGPGGTTPAPTTPAPSGGGTGGNPSRANGPVSLINVRSSGAVTAFQVGVPVPEVRPVFSAAQKKALGVESTGNEVRFPVVHVTF